MGLLDALRRKPRPMLLEGISLLPAAAAGLSAAGIVFSDAAGICLKAPRGGHTGPSKLDLTGLLAGAALPARYELASDEYGCTWVILRGSLDSVAMAVTRACGLLNGAGYGGDILCIPFEFRKDDRKVYWIYNRDGRFYPFAPENNEHDVRFELHMKDAVSGVMPVEAAVNKWYPLWGMPF
jgi:hypothetical protein